LTANGAVNRSAPSVMLTVTAGRQAFGATILNYPGSSDIPVAVLVTVSGTVGQSGFDQTGPPIVVGSPHHDGPNIGAPHAGPLVVGPPTHQLLSVGSPYSRSRG
jgi:hypothetical protein